MELRLDLRSHCIETEIKRLHEQAVMRYFKPHADKAALEETIELLEKVLKTFDFRKLRSGYPALCGHTEANVVLYTVSGGLIRIRIDDATVETC